MMQILVITAVALGFLWSIWPSEGKEGAALATDPKSALLAVDVPAKIRSTPLELGYRQNGDYVLHGAFSVHVSALEQDFTYDIICGRYKNGIHVQERSLVFNTANFNQVIEAVAFTCEKARTEVVGGYFPDENVFMSWVEAVNSVPFNLSHTYASFEHKDHTFDVMCKRSNETFHIFDHGTEEVTRYGYWRNALKDKPEYAQDPIITNAARSCGYEISASDPKLYREG